MCDKPIINLKKEESNKIIVCDMERMKKEIKEEWFGFFLTSLIFTCIFWFFEPTFRSLLKEELSEGSVVTNIFNIIFNYVFIGLYYLIFTFVIISITRKWWTIRKCKKKLKNNF